MGFSVPLDFHKAEKDCHLIQFTASISGESLFLASIISSPILEDSAKRRVIFERGDFIEERTDYDQTGEISALISALILCLEHNIKTIFIEGVCDMVRKEGGDFINNLFGQFDYVYFKGELTETTGLDTIIEKVKSDHKIYFVENI